MNRAPTAGRGAGFWIAPAIAALIAFAPGAASLAQTDDAPSPPILTPLPPLSQHETPPFAPDGDATPEARPDASPEDSVEDSAPAEETAAREAEREEDLDPAAALDKAFEELKSDDEEIRAKAGNRIVKLWSRSGSASMDLLLQRGKDAIERDDADAADEHLTDLVTLAPEFAEGWHMRAQVHAMKEDYAGALFDLAETVALEQRHFLAFAELGALLEDLGREQEALEAFRRALEIFPAFEPAKNAEERLAPSVDGRGA